MVLNIPIEYTVSGFYIHTSKYPASFLLSLYGSPQTRPRPSMIPVIQEKYIK